MDSYVKAGVPTLPTAEQISLVNKLGFFQRRQLKLAADQKLGRELIATIATGYSDLGWAGTRGAKGMRRMRELLTRNQMRFSSITLLAQSDETLFLYGYGFDRELALRDILPVVEAYREEVRNVQSNCSWMGRRRQNRLIVKAYEDAVKTLSHYGTTAA